MPQNAVGNRLILLWRFRNEQRESPALVPDAQLVARVRLGDVEAFGQLAERYERSLLAIALAKVRDVHEAEDVVQATLLVAFRRLGTLREESKFGPWLMQIARSQVVEAVRARRIPASIPLNGPDHDRRRRR